MPNIKSKFKTHNVRILNELVNQKARKCNCITSKITPEMETTSQKIFFI